MNTLSVSLQHSIMTLAANGWSQRRIARELGIHRETVGRYLRQSAAKPAKVPTGSEAEGAAKPADLPLGSEPVADPKPAKVPAGIFPRSRSQCESWRERLEQGVQAGLTAQRLYQDLVVEHQFAGSYAPLTKITPINELRPAGWDKGKVRKRMVAPSHLRGISFN